MSRDVWRHGHTRPVFPVFPSYPDASLEVWSRWRSMTDGFVAAPGTRITAVPWPNWGFALFGTGADGSVYTAAADPQAGLPAAWAKVSDGLIAAPATPITAVPWPGWGFALFATGADGSVYTAAGDPQKGLAGSWASVSDGLVAAPATPVSALSWPGWGFALFVTTADGSVYTAAGDPQKGLAGPWVSVSQGRSTPGAGVTALPWGNRFALFVADPNGGIYTTGGDPQADFGPWASVSEGRSTPGAPVAAAPWGNGFALAVSDPSGGIWTTGGDPQGGFGSWSRVKDASSTPGAPVTLVPWNNRLALFLTGAAGTVQGGFIVTTDGDPVQPLGVPHADAPQSILELGPDLGQFVGSQPSDPNWASSDAKTYPIDRDIEWKQVVDFGEYEQVVAVLPVPSTTSVGAASGWVHGPENSGADVPFSHPFGGFQHFPYGRVDWEFGLLPDDHWKSLLSPANQDIIDELSEEPGTLGVEIEQGLLPESFRGNVSHGDRVAICGQWILDQGHTFDGGQTHPPSYRTEIHPPLLMATGSVQQDGSGAQFTRVLFMSRPYLTAQTYTSDPSKDHDDAYKGDGTLITYMQSQVKNNIDSDPPTLPVYSRIKEYPYKSTNPIIFEILVRPPVQATPDHQLSVAFQFTARHGCTVQVATLDYQSVSITVTLASGPTVSGPALPGRTQRSYTLDDLDLLRPGAKQLILDWVNTLPEHVYLICAERSKVLHYLENVTIQASEYARPAEVNVLDRSTAVSTVVLLPTPGGLPGRDILPGQGITASDDQPYPLYGWLEVGWAPKT